jgi:hypothetical protein
LFTGASKRLAHVLTLAITAVIVIGLDVGFGAVVHQILPEPPAILHTLQGGNGIIHFWNLTDSNVIPIVVTGSSMMEQAFSPNAFSQDMQQLTGKPLLAANVSVPTATVPFSYRFIRDVIGPTGVRTIIYGTEMRAFAPDNGFLLDSPLGNAITRLDGPLQSLDMWLLHHSALFQYHVNIRQILAGERELSPFKFERPEDPGWVIRTDFYDGHDLSGLPLLSTIVDYDLAVENLNNLANFCKAQHLNCIVANMPVMAIVTKNVRAREALRYRDALKHLVQSGVEVWDFNTPECLYHFGSGFSELNHLNQAGAYKFTEMTAELYAHRSLGVSLPPDALATCINVNQDIYSSEF